MAFTHLRSLTIAVVFLTVYSPNVEGKNTTNSCNNATTPCNQGKCTAVDDGNKGTDGTDGTDGIEICDCNDGWSGDACDQESICTRDDPCVRGLCTAGDDASSYKCTCMGGFIGTNCDIANPCRPNPCSNGGQCTPKDDTRYGCSCTGGWGGATCDVGEA